MQYKVRGIDELNSKTGAKCGRRGVAKDYEREIDVHQSIKELPSTGHFCELRYLDCLLEAQCM